MMMIYFIVLFCNFRCYFFLFVKNDHYEVDDDDEKLIDCPLINKQTKQNKTKINNFVKS